MIAGKRTFHWRIGGTRLLCIAFLVLLLFAAVSGGRAEQAEAHSVLVRSDPAANAKLPQSPRVVSIYFSEPLEAKFSGAKVVDTNGAGQDQGDSRVDAGDPTHLTLGVKTLKPGFYSVVWTTVSKDDGHKLQGSFPFIVLNPDGSLPAGAAPEPPTMAIGPGGNSSSGVGDVLAFWLSILGAVALFGAAMFTLVVALPATAVLADDGEIAQQNVVTCERRLAWLAVCLLVAGSLGQLLLQMRLIGGIGALGDFVTTSFGAYLFARIGLALAAGCCLLALRWAPGPSSRAPILSLLCLSGFGMILCFALTSHAGAIGNGTFWAVLGELLHLTMVGVWLGGLLSLVLLFAVTWLPPNSMQLRRYRAALVARFSPLAAAAVTLILLSGVFNAVIEVPTLAGLVRTAYGRALLLKLAVIVPLLAAAGTNAFVLRPRLEAAVSKDAKRPSGDALQVERRLRRMVLMEAGFGLMVLLAVGLLFLVPPSRDLAVQAAQSSAPANGTSVYSNSASAAGLTIQLTVDPNKVGLYTYRVKLADAQGPVSDATLVRLDLAFADPKFGTSNVVLAPVDSGVYQEQGANFAQVGRWQVTVVVRRVGQDDALCSFTVEVPDAAGNLTINRVSQADAFASPSRLFTVNQLAGMVLLLAGLAPLVLRKRLWRSGTIVGAAGTFSGVAGLILGGTLFFATHTEGSVDYTLKANPVPVSNESVDAGKGLYQQNCVVCHGDTGHGDGPAARALNPQPFDLTVHVGLHADGVLWGWISDGIPRTAMPAWRGKLTDTERWQLVDFLRTQFQPSASASPPNGEPPSKQAVVADWAAILDSRDAHANP